MMIDGVDSFSLVPLPDQPKRVCDMKVRKQIGGPGYIPKALWFVLNICTAQQLESDSAVRPRNAQVKSILNEDSCL